MSMFETFVYGVCCKVPGPLRIARFPGSRTSVYVNGLSFQEVPAPLRMSRFRGSRTSSQCVEVPGPRQGFKVPGPLSRFRGSRTSAYQGFEVLGLLRMSRF